MERINTNTTQNHIWISIADAITALFFVFLILFIITLFLRNKSENDFNAYVEGIIEQVDSLGFRTYGRKILFDSEDFFQSGEAQISNSAKDSLRLLANSIRKQFLANEQLIMIVIGHTDSIPIRENRLISRKVEDNWDLSVQRAKQTREFIVEICRFPSARVLPAGFADQLPKVSNLTIAGRAQNRRIELFLTDLNSIGAKPWKDEYPK